MERHTGTDAQMEEFSGTVMDSKTRTIIHRWSSTHRGGKYVEGIRRKKTAISERRRKRRVNKAGRNGLQGLAFRRDPRYMDEYKDGYTRVRIQVSIQAHKYTSRVSGCVGSLIHSYSMNRPNFDHIKCVENDERKTEKPNGL